MPEVCEDPSSAKPVNAENSEGWDIYSDTDVTDALDGTGEEVTVNDDEIIQFVPSFEPTRFTLMDAKIRTSGATTVFIDITIKNGDGTESVTTFSVSVIDNLASM